MTLSVRVACSFRPGTWWRTRKRCAAKAGQKRSASRARTKLPSASAASERHGSGARDCNVLLQLYKRRLACACACAPCALPADVRRTPARSTCVPRTHASFRRQCQHTCRAPRRALRAAGKRAARVVSASAGQRAPSGEQRYPRAPRTHAGASRSRAQRAARSMRSARTGAHASACASAEARGEGITASGQQRRTAARRAPRRVRRGRRAAPAAGCRHKRLRANSRVTAAWQAASARVADAASTVRMLRDVLQAIARAPRGVHAHCTERGTRVAHGYA